jgi:hypothetical protein
MPNINIFIKNILTNKLTYVAILFILVCIGIISAGVSKKVFINGKEYSDSIVSNGKYYVSVSSLKDAGALVNVSDKKIDIQFDPLKGRLQGDMIEGNLQEWLSNGTWRVYVHNVEKLTDYNVYKVAVKVTIEFRNISNSTLSLNSSGTDQFILLDDKGNKLSPIADREYDKLFYSSIVKADGVKVTLTFADIYNRLEELGNLDKIMITFRPSGGSKPLKGFRIFINK